jgi:hypothetical protein
VKEIFLSYEPVFFLFRQKWLAGRKRSVEEVMPEADAANLRRSNS